MAESGKFYGRIGAGVGKIQDQKLPYMIDLEMSVGGRDGLLRGSDNVNGKGPVDYNMELGFGYNITDSIRAELVYGLHLSAKQKGSSKPKIELFYTDTTPPTFAGVSGDDEVSASAVFQKRILVQSFMVKAMADVVKVGPSTLFVTAGGGISRVGSLIKIKGDAQIGFTTARARSTTTYYRTNFAYALGAGASFKMSDDINLDVQYEFTDLGKEFNKTDFCNKPPRIRVHLAKVGVRIEL